MVSLPSPPRRKMNVNFFADPPLPRPLLSHGSNRFIPRSSYHPLTGLRGRGLRRRSGWGATSRFVVSSRPRIDERADPKISLGMTTDPRVLPIEAPE